MKRAKQNKLVQVLDNETRFHFTHIQDVIVSILEVIDLLGKSDNRQKYFELWSEDSYTAEELADLVVSTFKSDSIIDYAFRESDKVMQHINFSYKKCKFSPKFSLREELLRLSES